MPIYQNTLLRKKNSLKTGNASSQTRIKVTDQFGTESTIYSNESLTNIKPNPFKTDSEGFFEFYATAGKYKLEIGNPIVKKIDIELYDTPEVEVGINFLSNNSISTDYLQRNNSTQLISDYPDLAGTNGYDIDVTPGGIVFDSNYNSDEEISSVATTIKNAYIVNGGNHDGRILISGTTQTGDTGAFIYSSDGGATEDYAATVNTVAKICIAFNSSYTLAGGSSGNISVYDTTGLFYITNQLAGTREIRFIEYNESIALWLAVNDLGDIYTSVDPTSSWAFSASISGLSGSLNFFEKTRDGYLIFDDSTNEVKFCSSLISSPSASVVISATASNFLFSKCSNNLSGKVFIATQAGSGRMYFRSEDGGQSFTEIFPTGFDANNLSDLIHAGNDVWVALFAFGASVRYSVDFGDTWQTVSYTKPTGAGNGNRLFANKNGDIIATFTGDLTTRTLFTSLTPTPTEFNVSQLDSPNLTDSFYVKAR